MVIALTLTVGQVKNLLKKGSTEVIKGFKNKSGKSFDAALVYQAGKLKFDFPEAGQRRKS